MKCFLIAVLVWISSAVALAVTPTPLTAAGETVNDPVFWRTNVPIFKRITDERACVVSAHRDDQSDGTLSYVAHGGILISAPREQSFRISQDYAHLKDICDYFKEVGWNPETRRLHIVIDALGYKKAMDVHLVPRSTAERDEIDFDIPEGEFKGLSGVTAYEDYGFGKTLSSLEIHFATKNPPLPKLFMSVAMEIVTQKVGERLRTYIEKEPERLKGKQNEADSRTPNQKP